MAHAAAPAKEDDYHCRHSLSDTSKVTFYQHGVAYCTKECYLSCQKRKADAHHKEDKGHGVDHHNVLHAKPVVEAEHHGRKSVAHPEDHGNLALLNKNYAPTDDVGVDVSHRKFSQTKHI